MPYALPPPSKLRNVLINAARVARKKLVGPLRHLPGSSLSFGPPRRVERSTEHWIGKRRGAGAVTRVSTIRDVSRSMPRHADEPIAERFRSMMVGHIKSRSVADLPGARYWGNAYGCAISTDDAILHDFSPTFSDFEAPFFDSGRHDGLFRLKLPTVRKISGVMAAINTYGHDNFHHWLLDSVPAFGLLQEAGWDLSAFDSVILRSNHMPFHRETLLRMGLRESQIIVGDSKSHLWPDRLVVPSYSEPGRQPELFNYTPEGLKYVRSLFLDGRTSSPVDADKIVISREKTNTRRLVNGERIHETLRRHGFVTVYLEDFTVAQQAALFQRARIVIMPTGGGLANVVFSTPGTRFIELFNPAYLPTFCLPLCHALGLEYVALVGEDTVKAGGHSDIGGLADVVIAEDKLLEWALTK